MHLGQWSADVAGNMRENCFNFLKNCAFGVIIAAMIAQYLLDNIALDKAYSKYTIF